jgi:hypothetical protein
MQGLNKHTLNNCIWVAHEESTGMRCAVHRK